ncbi:MAG: branched-chain amino acid ABC transporter substrate-binding protein [Thermoanaerobaculaceae bacterium]|nr:branched-chain amino acid ABC transporter substrate-binding protein [Thermoanaerobaculaceae bacterium]MDI9622583.1 branched-chain amino acid ABC transporter substrate-binding protein [Acidobacteriota bacterium]NLH10691.1 amino acid ABC transporter substrate-binding protein [Holophagae bacterium]HPW54668.1 branched-chain amino acid ABC transporter substrate-binding protein [Thermoanaerobaculaceae bacterium]
MKRILVGLIVVGAALSTACGGKKLIVGVVLPESGVAKAYGPSLKAGIKLAFDDAVARNTPKGFEARYRDSMSNPEYAIKEVQELVKGGAIMVIGGATSEEAKAMIPEARKANVVLISPSASEPGLASSGNPFFRMYPSDDAEALVAARFLVTTRKATRILVLFQKGLYSAGMLPVLRDEIVKLGATVVDELPIGPTDWDKNINEALATKTPDAVFICGYGEEALATLSLLRAAKFEGFVCASSAIGTTNIIERAGELAEGVFVPVLSIDFDSEAEPIASFVKRFKAANGGAMPDVYAAHGYDAAMMALAALQDPRPKDTNEILHRLLSIGTKRGVTGTFTFDEVGNSTHRPRMHQIQHGQFEDCDPTSAS